MSFIITLGLLFLVGIGALGYLAYIKRIRRKSLERTQQLELERDTLRIVEEHKREQVAKTWEEFDKEQWTIRFNKELEKGSKEQ
jgi:hypothetical protein